MLTLEAARARGLEVVALVVNHVSAETDLATSTLAETLADLGVAPRIVSVPHGIPPDAALAGLARDLAKT